VSIPAIHHRRRHHRTPPICATSGYPAAKHQENTICKVRIRDPTSALAPK
jgi:hypothetical protein